jgi:beta-N-acetylhexosaminidase
MSVASRTNIVPSRQSEDSLPAMIQLMHSFHGKRAPQEMLDAVRQGAIASFLLFAGMNVDNPAQLRELTVALRQAAKEGGQPVPIIGIDQEGGQLIPIRAGATELPGNMALGATRSEALTEEAGRVMARELLAMGINMNFAPVVDVNNNPANPALGIRAFGDNPQLVGELGAALARGMQAEGVLATAKHFPGLGDTVQDSHFAAPIIPHSRERLDAMEFAPFKMLIDADVSAIMTTHMIYPALDAENPATISPHIVTELLRDEWGYTGLVITDAMDMHAVSRLGDVNAVRAALRAGIDLVMLGHIRNQLALQPQVIDLARPDAISRIRAAQALLSDDIPPLSVVGSAEHQAVAQKIADASITLVRDTDARLPLRLAPQIRIAVITIRPINLTPADTSLGVTIKLAHAITQRHAQTMALELDYQANEGQMRDVLAATANADVVIIGTQAADRDPTQAALVRALHEAGKALIVVALRTPYDLTAFPMITTYLCAYGIRDVTTEAIARVLFGEIPARGELPCQLPNL